MATLLQLLPIPTRSVPNRSTLKSVDPSLLPTVARMLLLPAVASLPLVVGGARMLPVVVAVAPVAKVLVSTRMLREPASSSVAASPAMSRLEVEEVKVRPYKYMFLRRQAWCSQSSCHQEPACLSRLIRLTTSPLEPSTFSRCICWCFPKPSVYPGFACDNRIHQHPRSSSTFADIETIRVTCTSFGKKFYVHLL